MKKLFSDGNVEFCVDREDGYAQIMCLKDGEILDHGSFESVFYAWTQWHGDYPIYIFSREFEEGRIDVYLKKNTKWTVVVSAIHFDEDGEAEDLESLHFGFKHWSRAVKFIETTLKDDDLEWVY